MINIISDIKQYSRDIVQKDINAEEELPDWMNNPLPLDRSSSNRKILIPQLMKTVGHDCNIFTNYFRKIESQEQCPYSALLLHQVSVKPILHMQRD